MLIREKESLMKCLKKLGPKRQNLGLFSFRIHRIIVGNLELPSQVGFNGLCLAHFSKGQYWFTSHLEKIRFVDTFLRLVP